MEASDWSEGFNHPFFTIRVKKQKPKKKSKKAKQCKQPQRALTSI